MPQGLLFLLAMVAFFVVLFIGIAFFMERSAKWDAEHPFDYQCTCRAWVRQGQSHCPLCGRGRASRS
jgi:hypothetical protein